MKFSQRAIVIFLCVQVALQAGIYFLFHNFEKQYEKSVFRSAQAILHNEASISNSYQMARTLSDMEAGDWLSCVRLRELAPIDRIYYDSTFRANCGRHANVEGVVEGVNGSRWQLEFEPSRNFWLEMSEYLVHVFVFSLSCILFVLFQRYKWRQEEVQKILNHEKRFLQDLAKQTHHDVASPISAIRMIASVAKLDPNVKSLLERSVARVEGIFNDLESAKNLSGVPESKKTRFDISKLISEVVSEKESLWSERVEFTLTLSSCIIYASKTDLSRVISNLLNNSFEAKQEGELARISINVNSRGDFGYIEITDNGKGIPLEVLTRVGRKGFSFGKISIPNGPGQGLGVHHAIATVESCGGKLEITSTENIGTTVSIRIPALRENQIQPLSVN